MLSELKLKYDDNKAMSIRLNTESEFFSGLTPKLVWAGAGEKELELSNSFMNVLCKAASGKSFTSQGDCAGFAMQHLRGWEFTENKEFDDQKPRDIIIKERQENFKKKGSYLEKV